MIRLLATTAVAALVSGTVSAETLCATFDHHPPGTVFANPGDVIFKDDAMEIRTGAFPTGYGAVEVIPDNGIGVSNHVLSLNNASYQLIARKPFASAQAWVRDQGGFEMIDVTGAFPMQIELHDSPSIATPLARINGSVSTNDGVGRILWEMTADYPLFSIGAGGQEFSVGQICIETP